MIVNDGKKKKRKIKFGECLVIYFSFFFFFFIFFFHLCSISMTSLGKVNVIGAGVVGLTTALLLQSKGYEVTVIADYFPGDTSHDYTSPFAGARWKTLAPNSDLRLQSKIPLLLTVH